MNQSPETIIATVIWEGTATIATWCRGYLNKRKDNRKTEENKNV